MSVPNTIQSQCMRYNRLSCQQKQRWLKTQIETVLSLNVERCMLNFVHMSIFSAFHNLQSNIPIDWHTPQGMSPLQARQSFENAYIKNIYNQRVNQQIQNKYKTPIDTFRAIPNQITLKKDKDALTQQIQQFNHSRIHSPSHANGSIEKQQQNTMSSHKSQPELPTNQPLLNKKIEIEKVGLDRSYNTHEHNPESNEIDRYASLHRNKDPYSVQKNFNKGLMNEYRRYAHCSPHSPEFHPMRNLFPDKLEEFLRERTKEDRKSILRASISHSKHLPQ